MDLILGSLKALIRGEGEIQIGLWGEAGSGKTHLLNAGADYARKHGIVLQIYDARQLLHCDAAEFEGFAHCDVLAIDNLDALAGNPDWETCFYQVINRCRQGEYRFMFTSAQKPEDLSACLDDFRSRLQWGLLMQLPSNTDADIREILRQRARLLGFELSSGLVSYLMTHYERNLATQMEILLRLDGASLSHKRKVTIPLLKQVLSEPCD